MTEGKLNILADEAVVRMAQEGSATAYEYLIQKYREVAKIKARTYYIAGGDNEDAVQEGMIGIFKAVRDYEPGAGASFSSFLELCVDRQIKTAMSGANRHKHKILTESVSLVLQEGESENGNPDIAHMMTAGREDEPENAALIKEAVELMRKAGEERLSRFERRVWNEMLKGETYREIADVLQKSPKTIDNAIQRIKKKIRLDVFDY